MTLPNICEIGSGITSRMRPGCLLVPGYDQPDVASRKRVQQIQVFLSRNTEHKLDVLVLQGPYKKV